MEIESAVDPDRCMALTVAAVSAILEGLSEKVWMAHLRLKPPGAISQVQTPGERQDSRRHHECAIRSHFV